MALWLHGCGPRTASVVRFRSTTACQPPLHATSYRINPACGISRFLSRIAPRAGLVTSRQTFVRRCQCVWHGLKSSRRGARLARLWPARQSPEVPAMPDHVSNSVWCSLSPTGHPNRGIDRVFETVSVVGRGLVSIAEVHAIVARAHLAKSEPEMTSDRFGFSERHGFVKSPSGSTSKATGHSGGKSTPCRYPLLAEYAS
jgi:hypothetical protein